MIKDDFIYIEHMLLYGERIIEKLHGRTKSEFEHDQDLKDLIVYRLQVIGEAASHISRQFQDSHSNIEWSNIIGMRHRLVHGYLDIDYGIVWDIVVNDIPRLVSDLKKIIQDDWKKTEKWMLELL